MKQLNRKVLGASTISFLLMTDVGYASSIELKDAEMDVVTAGYISLSIDAIASAQGLNPSVQTNTYTETNEITMNGWGFGYGSGYGSATACCDNTSTNVNAALEASDDVVLTFASATNHQTGGSSYSTAWLGVFTISIPQNAPSHNIESYFPY